MANKLVDEVGLKTVLTKLKAKLSKVAFSGSYNDLKDVPNSNIFEVVDGKICVVYDDGKD